MLIVYGVLIFFQTDISIFYLIDNYSNFCYCIYYTKLLSKISFDNASLHELHYSMNEVKHIYIIRVYLMKCS